MVCREKSAKERYTKRLKSLNIKISEELRNIIHGYIMSDGYVTEEGSLQVQQSIQQEKFVEWLYNKLETLRTKSPIVTVLNKDKRTNTITYSKRFYTRNVLKGFRRMWYKPCTNKQGKIEYIKSLPKSLPCFFNADFISLWFAGDGTKILGQTAGAKIEVTAFTESEREQLKNLFQSKFEISVTINKAGVSQKGKEQWTLNINANDYPKFKKLVTKMDLIPEIFPYKIY